MGRQCLLIVCAAALAACTLADLPPMDADIPADWGKHSTNEIGSWPALEWWREFGSDELTALMEEVRERNLDLRENARNLRRAQMALKDTGLDIFGAPSAGLNASRGYSGADQPGGPFRGSGTQNASASIGSSLGNLPDIPLRHATALRNYQSAEATVASTRVGTYVTTAQAYFRVLLARDQIEAAKSNLERARVLENITNTRLEVGQITPLEALQQQIQVRQQELNVLQLQHSEYTALAALALLVAKPTSALQVQAGTLAGVNAPEIVPGLPSELLVRRPDLVQAEIGLRNARADVAIARNALFPRISLTGSSSLASDSLRELTSGGVLSLSLGSSVVQNLFDFGRLGRGKERARLNLQSAIDNYRRTVLRAFRDIEVSLGSIKLLEMQAQIQDEQLRSAEESLRIAELQYTEGAVPYLDLLTAQQSLFGARNAVLITKSAYLNAMITLYQSLGGGWQASPED